MKVSNPTVSNLPQTDETEPQSAAQGCEKTQEASGISTGDVKTAVKVAATGVDLFEKYASSTPALEKFAAPANVAKYALKGVGAGLTASQQYDNAASGSTAGKTVEAGLAAGAYLAVSSHPVTSAVDLATGGEVTKGLASSTSAVVGLTESAVTGETAALENYHQRARAGELGAFAQLGAKLGDATVEAREYWEKRGVSGTLEDFKAALLDK